MSIVDESPSKKSPRKRPDQVVDSITSSNRLRTSFLGSMLSLAFKSDSSKTRASMAMPAPHQSSMQVTSIEDTKRKTVFGVLDKFKASQKRQVYRSQNKHLSKYFNLSDKVEDLKSKLKKEQSFIGEFTRRNNIDVSRKFSSFSTADSDLSKPT